MRKKKIDICVCVCEGEKEREKERVRCARVMTRLITARRLLMA